MFVCLDVINKVEFWHVIVVLQTKVDLFASPPPASCAAIPAMDFFAAAVQPQSQPEINKPSESYTTTPTKIVDPFAAVPMTDFDNSDFFGSFSSHTETDSLNNQNLKTPPPPPPLSSKKDGFQVKSGVWADSLSRGLIDLNISGRKYLIFFFFCSMINMSSNSMQ